MALIAYPEAQKKAQDEIDRVVGEHRMPTLNDLDHMPYIRGMILEVGSFLQLLDIFSTGGYLIQTHRFRPVAPLMVPHATLAPEEVRLGWPS
jgi:hypothetical protein